VTTLEQSAADTTITPVTTTVKKHTIYKRNTQTTAYQPPW